MSPSEHSEFSPSGMASKLKCRGQHLAVKQLVEQAIAEGKQPKKSGGPAADRGTECHDWAEKLLPAVLTNEPPMPVPPFIEDWQEDCTKEMVQHAVEKYNELAVHGEVEVILEQRVDLGCINSNSGFDLSRVFGTCDVLLFCKAIRTLVVLDYKTGMGWVGAKDNVQLSIYGLGAMCIPGIQGHVDKVQIVVSQPRTDKEAKVWNTTRIDLLQWCADELIPALVEMDAEGASFNPGTSQCQWCPMAGRCDAQTQKNIGMMDDYKAKKESTTVGQPILTPQEVNDNLLRLPEFTQFVKQIQGTAQGMLEDGDDLPDFKLVHGRGSRDWTDKEAAEKFLIGQKLKDKERHTYKLLTPPQAEKVLKQNLKRTITKNNFYKLVVKKEGKITWALKTDKREAIIINPVADMLDVEDLI